MLEITNVYVVDFIDLWTPVVKGIFAVLEEFQFKHQINSKQAACTHMLYYKLGTI